MACPQPNQPTANRVYLYGEPDIIVSTTRAGANMWKRCKPELRAALVAAFNAVNKETAQGVLEWEGIELYWYGSRNCIGSISEAQ